MSKIKVGLLFCASAAVAGVAVHPSAASAAWVLQAPQECFVTEAGNIFAHPKVTGAAGLRNQSTNNAAEISCPAPETSAFPKNLVNTLNVEVFDGTPSSWISAAACVTFRTSLGGSCGDYVLTGASPSAVGHFQLKPSTAVWASNPDGAGYVTVVLPNVSSVGGESKLSAVWYSNG